MTTRELAIHRSRGVEGVGQFPGLGLEMGDALALSDVVGFQVGGPLLKLIEERAEGLTSGKVSLGAELAFQPVAKDLDFLGEPAGLFFGVGQLGPQALFANEGAGRESPGPVATGLTLAVPDLGDLCGEEAVGIQHRDGDPGTPSDGGEADRSPVCSMARTASAARWRLVWLSCRRARRRAALLSAVNTFAAAPAERHGHGLAGLAESGRCLVDHLSLVAGEPSERLFVGLDVVDHHPELPGDAFDRPVGGADGKHRFALSTQAICVGLQFGEVGRIGVEVRAAGALVADGAGLAAGSDVGGLGALAHGHRNPR